jgi:uncharacterized damage-inducible protein DinB
MTTCQTITLDFDAEMANTRKLLERVPIDDAHRGYKPHPKSMALDRLATHVAELPSWVKMTLETDVLEMQPGFKPRIAGSTAELLEIFDKNVADTRAAIDAAKDEDMHKTWSFKMGGKTFFSAPRIVVVRTSINHMTHHRAQLGVYLRLNEIAIPGMYGPSADDSMPLPQ